MAYIVPFRALRYNPERVSLAETVTQPYDKISPAMQQRYYAASPFNLVRIILGKHEPGDGAEENVYTRAATSFRDWRRQGVFRQDSEPSIYVYAQRFVVPATRTEMERRGFIALGRLEDYSAGVVFRHEQTLARPKADRLALLRATRAHFGQIFMLYRDSGEIDRLVAQNTAPLVAITDEYGVLHRLWRVFDAGVLASVCARMRDKQLIIADGHHRYETALNYRDERRAATTPSTGALDAHPREPGVLPPFEGSYPPHDFLMMTFVNMEGRGVVILPTHRVVHGLPSFSAESFGASARAYFNLEEVEPAIDPARAAAILGQAGQVGAAFLAATASRVFLLHTPKAPPDLFPGWSLRQQALDVVQLHQVVLERVLGLSPEAIRNQQNLAYVREAGEALAAVRGGSANVAFLMNPCRMERVRDLALAGEVLPQKSTDFYPKLLSGLTIYALE